MQAEALDEKILLRGQAPASLFTVLPQMEGRKKWQGSALHLLDTGHNRRLLASVGIEVPEQRKPLPPLLSSNAYQPKSKPFDHQVRAAEKMEGKNVFALFMEQGTGKTKALIDWAGRLFAAGLITGVLAVSKKGVHRQWIENELEAHCGVPYLGDYWPLKALPEDLKDCGDTLKWLGVNWDSNGQEEVEKFCAAHKGRLLIIADESQDMKNYASRRHKNMMKLKPFSTFRALATGTPIAKDLTDEWSQLLWLEESIIGIRYVTTFRRRYCVMGGFENRSVIGHVNIDEFKGKTEPYVFRATKEEIGLLPKRYSKWSFDLHQSQKDLIKELRDELRLSIRSEGDVTAANAAVAMLRVQQIGCGFITNSEGEEIRILSVDENPRIQAMLEYLASFEGKVILWWRFREEGRLVAEALGQAGISYVEYHGGVNDRDRNEAKERFLNEGGPRVFSANAQTAGTGLNLQGLCRNAGYLSNSFKSIDRWQSEDRIHRIDPKNPIGTVSDCTYTDFIGKGSMDNYTLNNIRGKKALSDLVLGGVKMLLEENDEIG